MNEENLTTGIALLILLSAVFHASWNALLKKGNDKLLDILFAEILILPFALVLIFFAPLPNPESWPFLLLSAGIHISYMYFLAKTYTSGDLSHAYVLLRGFSPFLIALGGHFLLGESLSSQSWFGITVISCGLLFITDLYTSYVLVHSFIYAH
jgi:drug/metabolite transporter (DMT)-like permease